jgi:hypothetical protein
MKRALAVPILMAVAWLMIIFSVVSIVVRGGDEAEVVAQPPPTSPPPTAPPGPPKPVTDACTVLPADIVARGLGLPANRVTTIAHPILPGQAARCSYKDADANMFVFFIQVQDLPDPVEAREQIEAFTGSPVPGLGDVARYEQLEGGDSTINLVSGVRQIFLGTRGRRLSQDAMAGLAREVLARAR